MTEPRRSPTPSASTTSSTSSRRSTTNRSSSSPTRCWPPKRSARSPTTSSATSSTRPAAQARRGPRSASAWASPSRPHRNGSSPRRPPTPPRSTRTPASAGSPPRARNVVVDAQNKAHDGRQSPRSRPTTCSSALFTDPDGLAAKLLAGQGVDADRSREAVTLPPGPTTIPALIPSTAPAKKVLELTFRQALRLGHNYIGTEHIVPRACSKPRTTTARCTARCRQGPLRDAIWSPHWSRSRRADLTSGNRRASS